MQNKLYISVDLFSASHNFNDINEDEDLENYDITKLKKTATVEFVISDLYQCKFEYLNVNFSDANYSQCEGYVTCSLLNYKFVQPQMIKRMRSNCRVPSIKNSKQDLEFAINVTKNKDWIDRK
jgi:hypothetical protein